MEPSPNFIQSDPADLDFLLELTLPLFPAQIPRYVPHRRDPHPEARLLMEIDERARTWANITNPTQLWAAVNASKNIEFTCRVFRRLLLENKLEIFRNCFTLSHHAFPSYVLNGFAVEVIRCNPHPDSREELFTLLYARGWRYDGKDTSVLRVAMWYFSIPVVKWLLEHGHPVNEMMVGDGEPSFNVFENRTCNPLEYVMSLTPTTGKVLNMMGLLLQHGAHGNMRNVRYTQARFYRDCVFRVLWMGFAQQKTCPLPEALMRGVCEML